MQKLKNVVIVCDYAFFEGGAANVAIKSALSLANYTDLNVFCFAGCGEPCDELKSSRVNVISLNMPDLLGNKNKLDAFFKGIYNKNAGRQLKKLLSTLDNEETIIHIHTWTKVLSSSVFEVCHELNFKTFLTIHDYFLACPNGACFNYCKNQICEIQPMSLECIRCNCDSRSYAHKIWRCIRQYKQNKTIRNFQELNYIFISPFEEKQLLRRFPYVQNKFLIKNPINVDGRFHIQASLNKNYVYIGRLSGEKGVRLFCEAITRANVKGIVIGAGLLEEELKERYSNIEFTGWQNKQQIIERLKRCRALIFPSLWYEGSPLTVPEVQAYGIPCIVTNCNSAIDDIKNGINGEIIHADMADLVNSIKRFESDEYVYKLSENTYNLFDNNRCSEKWYVENLLRIYK